MKKIRGPVGIIYVYYCHQTHVRRIVAQLDSRTM